MWDKRQRVSICQRRKLLLYQARPWENEKGKLGCARTVSIRLQA